MVDNSEDSDPCFRHPQIPNFLRRNRRPLSFVISVDDRQVHQPSVRTASVSIFASHVNSISHVEPIPSAV